MSTTCQVDGCAARVVAGAPVPLCELHLAVAAEWSARDTGVTDILPAPCPACGSRLGGRYPSGWLCAICEWRAGDTVDDELPPPRVDVVYYLAYDERIKIGTSGNPRQRFAAIWHDRVLAFERGDRALEQRRHREFAADRLDRSEWFSRSPALLAHVEELAAGVEDPWDRYARWVSEAWARVRY
jgi:hypothetical protein